MLPRGSSSAVALIVILPLLMVMPRIVVVGAYGRRKSGLRRGGGAGRGRQLAVCPDGDRNAEILAAPRK